MKKIMFLLLLFCMAQRSAAETNDVAARVSEGRQLYLGGAFTKAIQAYADAWASGKATTDEAGYSVANEAGTELARMYSRLGRMDQLEPLLRELSTRRFFGAAARRLEDATGALWSMRHEPGTSFLCGPYALANVLQTFQGSEKAMPKAIADARSNSRGFSMDEVWKL